MVTDTAQGSITSARASQRAWNCWFSTSATPAAISTVTPTTTTVQAPVRASVANSAGSASNVLRSHARR